MRTSGIAALLMTIITITGCSPAFWGGAAGGAVGTGAGYEINANQQMKKLEEDFKAGRIDQREYDIRKDQLKRDSLLQ
jgi:hypothetical protein